MPSYLASAAHALGVRLTSCYGFITFSEEWILWRVRGLGLCLGVGRAGLAFALASGAGAGWLSICIGVRRTRWFWLAIYMALALALGALAGFALAKLGTWRALPWNHTLGTWRLIGTTH